MKPWEAERLIAKARILAVQNRLRILEGSGERVAPRILFTGESALLVAGLPTWNSNPKVTYVANRRRGNPGAMPTATIAGHKVAAVRTTQLNRGPALPPVSCLTVPGRPDITSWEYALADMARSLPEMQAFANACIVLRHLTGFNRFQPESSKQREENIRRTLQPLLRHMRGRPGARAFRHITQHATGAAESLGEGALLWALSVLLKPGVRVCPQHRVNVSSSDSAYGSVYFLDAALPIQKIGFEFDGVSKFAHSDADWDRQTKKFLHRQNQLRLAGWTLIRVTMRDLRVPDRALAILRNQLHPFGVCR